MRSFKFVHAADIHLDSPLTGLALPAEVVERFRGATRRAFENLVRLTIEEEAAFLLIAGDLFDGDWRDYQTGLFFVRQMARLRQAGIPVFIVRGNHDAESIISRRLDLPENVRIFSTRRPETIEIDDLGVAIHGRSYAEKAVTEDLSVDFPRAVPGRLNIGVLHTACEGHAAHENYAPTTVAALANRGYDYWALGHVHQQAVLGEYPFIVFSGNTQGRHARETGAKGCCLVSVADGRVEEVEFVATDAVRWAAIEAVVADAADADAALRTVRDALTAGLDSADGRALAVRLTIRGRSAAHREIALAPDRFRERVRTAAADLSPDGLWIEKVRLLTTPPVDIEGLRGRDDPLGGFLRGLAGLREVPDDGAGDPDQTGLPAALEDLVTKLPAEVAEGPDGLDLRDPGTIRALLDDVERLLVPRLLEGEGDRS